MAIISELEENEEIPKPNSPSSSSSSSSSSTNSSQFNAIFDPSNPDAKRKKQPRTAALPPEEKVNGKLEGNTDEKKEKNGRVPNKGNGLDMDNYSWTQTLQEVNVNVPIPKGTKSRFVVCEIKRNHLKVGLKGQPPVIDEELCHNVKPDDCFWNIEEQSIITILLTKLNQMEWWKYLVKGDPEIDTQKLEPESRKMSDYDPESRQTLAKLMFDQRQKSMGLPSSEVLQQQELMKKFMAEHPEVKVTFQGQSYHK